MRKLFLFSLLSTLFICTSEGKKVEGKIIFNADSVIKVTFNIPFNSMEDDIYYEGLQHVAYYFDANGKEVKLIPGSAKEIQFTYGYEKIRMLSIYYKNRFMFLKLLIDGNLKLYNYYSSRTNPGIRDPITGFSWGKGNTYNFEKYLMQKGDNLLKKPEKLAFKNDMVEYFADCPALVEKLEKKEYKKDDIESIVRFYNRNCK